MIRIRPFQDHDCDRLVDILERKQGFDPLPVRLMLKKQWPDS